MNKAQAIRIVADATGHTTGWAERQLVSLFEGDAKRERAKAITYRGGLELIAGHDATGSQGIETLRQIAADAIEMGDQA